MQATPRKLFNTLNSTLVTEKPEASSSVQTPTKRFNRSRDRSRSKSKEDSVESSTPQFFVKKVCTEFLDKEERPKELFKGIHQRQR